MKKFYVAVTIVLLVILSSCDKIQDVYTNVSIGIAVIIGIIEVLARVIPTVGMWAPLGVILKVLNFVSEFLNSEKKGKK